MFQIDYFLTISGKSLSLKSMTNESPLLIYSLFSNLLSILIITFDDVLIAAHKGGRDC